MESFQIVKPSALLAPYVKQYWFLETDDAADVPQRIIPGGCICLIFHWGERMFSLSENALQPRSFLGGQTTRYYDLRQTGKVNMACITFRPHGAKAFFGLPMNELIEQVVPTDALSDPALRELEGRLSDAYDYRICTELMESFLLKRLYVFSEYNHKRMAAAVQSVDLGQTNIATLAQISCLGYKQFKRIFAEYAGINPGDFLRIVRFQRALYLLQTYENMNFTRLTYECGYYDQPHLIKEFKTFSGYTPSEYIAVCPPRSDYFS